MINLQEQYILDYSSDKTDRLRDVVTIEQSVFLPESETKQIISV